MKAKKCKNNNFLHALVIRRNDDELRAVSICVFVIIRLFASRCSSPHYTVVASPTQKLVPA